MPIGAVSTSAVILEPVTSMNPPTLVGRTFNGNPMAMAAGNPVLGFLVENRQLYDVLAARGDLLRSSFNQRAKPMGLPATMTRVGPLFQTHLVPPPVMRPCDLLGQDKEALRDFQLFLRFNGVFIPQVPPEVLSTEHNAEDMEEVIRVHRVSLEACQAGDHAE